MRESGFTESASGNGGRRASSFAWVSAVAAVKRFSAITRLVTEAPREVDDRCEKPRVSIV